MNIRWSLFCVTIVALLTQPFAVLARSTGDWSAVKALANGQEVRVQTKTDKKIDGKLISVSDEKIVVDVTGKTEEIAFANVKKVHRVDKGSRGPGIALGAAVGAGAGAAIGIGAVQATGGSDNTGAVIAPIIAIGAGLGALAGAFVRKKKRTLIYEAK